MNLFKQQPISTAIAMVLAIVVVAAFASGIHMRTIHTYIGQSVVEFKAESHDPYTGRERDESPFIFPDEDYSHERFHFIYGKPGEEIHFPPARFIWVSQYAGVVTNVQINTSAQKETLDQVYGEMRQLGDEFAKAGWQATNPLPLLATIKSEIASAQGTTNGFGALHYSKGTSEARILLSTPGIVITPETVNQPAFVAQIEILDKSVEDEESEKAFAARKKVNGSNGISLPLSYWIKPSK